MSDVGHREAQPAAGRTAGGIAPGAISALLGELARIPEADLGSAWDRGLAPGAVIGRFELVREIGRGGFGVVYEARDRELGRSVAFKAVRAGGQASLREERVAREAETAARLSHPNIVTLYDVGRCEHGPYLVLELLRGQTLAARLAQGPIPLREALRVAVAVAEAMVHAHGQGVVHRDLTPGNVFLCDDGWVKVLDFGLAHAFGQRRSRGGTPSYMAPEQWRGAPEDERTDVFALGVILHRMLAGALPFPDDEGGKAVTGPRAAPVLDVPDVPALGGFLARMLAKDPVERPRDGAEVLAALSAFRRELERTSSGPPAPVRARRRTPRRLVGLIAAGVLLGAVAAGAFVRWRGSPEPEAGRVTVAVADFANQTGEPELNGLSGMLITSLEQSHRLSVLTRVRMLDILRQLGRSNVDVVDEALGRELALSAGVRALVLATIRRFDQLYSIEVKVLDPASSEYLFTLKEEARGKSSVPGMIDRLSEQTRSRLRESPADVDASRVRVADATTASFDAYQHYFRGEQLMDATRYEPALAEYRAAIAADPTFALAHYQIAYLGEFTGLDTPTRRAEIEAAIRNVERVPEKERLLIQAWKQHMDGRNDEAHARYALAADRYPQDKEVLYMAGDLYFHEGKAAEALPYFERSLVLDPTWEPGLMHLTDSLAALDRKEDLLARASWWAEKAPSGASYRALAAAHELAGHWNDAVAAARRAFDLDGSGFSRAALARTLCLVERYQEAEALLRPGAKPTATGTDRAVFPALAAVLAYQGKRREALRVLDEAPDDHPSKVGERRMAKLLLLMGESSLEPALHEAREMAQQEAKPPVRRGGLAAILVLVGDPERAAELAKGLEPGPDRAQYEATLAWKRGEWEKALSLVREPATRGDPDQRAYQFWLAARVQLDAHRDSEAVASLEALRTARAGFWRTWAYPESFYFEAQAWERLGDRGKARERLEHLLRLWKHADADVRYLAEARALSRRLGAGL